MKELYTALAKAQSRITGAVKDSANPFFKSKYADLSSVMEAIRIPFAENGLAYFQGARQTEGGTWVLHTKIVHSSGEEIGSDYPIICAKANDPQAFGAALTYARRFSLSAIAGVAQIDDDGNTAAATQGNHNLVKSPTPSKAQMETKELSTIATLIENCSNMDQLKRLWTELSKEQNSFTAEDFATLSLMKDKRKKEITNVSAVN